MGLDVEFFADVIGTGTGTTEQTVDVPDWVEFIDLAVLGGGGGADGGVIANGRSGNGAVWAAQILRVERLLGDANPTWNLTPQTHRLVMRYTVGRGGATGSGSGTQSIVAFDAVPRTTGTRRQLITLSSPGAQGSAIAALGVGGVNGPAGGGPSTGGQQGGTLGTRDLVLNGIVYPGGDGGKGGVQPGPGAGGCGGVIFGAAAQIGGTGKINWRYYTGSTIQQLSFTQGMPSPATITLESAPISAKQINFAVLGGGAGGGGAGLTPNSGGAGGLGGRWATMPNYQGDPLILADLLAAKGKTVSDVERLQLEYQVGFAGSGGNGLPLSIVPSTGGNGRASTATLKAVLNAANGGGTIILYGPITGPGGQGVDGGLVNLIYIGGAVTGGNAGGLAVGTGPNRLINLFGKGYLFRGGAETPSIITAGGQPGKRPGGGGSGGALPASNGGVGGMGAVHVVWG
jgi:hypothetical protein